MILPYRSPIKLEVSREGPAATARGGLVLLFEVLAAKRILVGLPRMGGSPAQGWSDAQMILAVLVLNVAGFDRVSDIEHLEADAGLCAMLGRFEAKLLGLSRRSIARRFRGGRERCFPSARSLRDWLDRFHVAGVHDVEREKGTAFIPAHTERHELFREVSRRLMAEGVREAGAVALTIDLDATIIASGKRECLYTYRAAEGLVPGERGYQPLVAFCPETGMVPWLEARDGNVPAAMDNQRGFEEALLQLPAQVRRVTLRTDGAGYQENVIRACNNPAFRPEQTRRLGTIGLICGATRSEELMAEVTRLTDDAWQPVAAPVETVPVSSHWKIDASVHQVSGSADVSSPVKGGDIHARGQGLSFGARWRSEHDYYATGRVSWTDYDLDISSDNIGLLISNVEADRLALRVEAGRRIPWGERAHWTPQVRVDRTQVRVDRFTDAVGARASFPRAERYRASLGVLADTTKRGWGGELSLWGSAHLKHAFGDTSTTSLVSGERLRAKPPADSVQLGLGATWQRGPWALNVALSARQAPGGSHTYSGSLNVGMQF